MLKITKKFGVSFLTMLLVSLLFIGTVSADEVTPFSNQDPGGGGTINGATMTYQITSTGAPVIDMYMDVKTAREFSEKVTQSDAEQLTWLGVGLGLGVKPINNPVGAAYVSIMGVMSSIQRGHVATDVRSYTNNNKKVKVSAYITSYMGKPIVSYSVTEWVGLVPNMSNVSGIRNLSVVYY